jgi:hypothetical protein
MVSLFAKVPTNARFGDGKCFGILGLGQNQREVLYALRTALLVLLALGHNGGAEPGAEIVGKLVELGIAVDLNGLLRGIANNVAVVAPGKMVFKLDFCFLVEYAVQITG